MSVTVDSVVETLVLHVVKRCLNWKRERLQTGSQQSADSSQHHIQCNVKHPRNESAHSLTPTTSLLHNR